MWTKSVEGPSSQIYVRGSEIKQIFNVLLISYFKTFPAVDKPGGLLGSILALSVIKSSQFDNLCHINRNFWVLNQYKNHKCNQISWKRRKIQT